MKTNLKLSLLLLVLVVVNFGGCITPQINYKELAERTSEEVFKKMKRKYRYKRKSSLYPSDYLDLPSTPKKSDPPLKVEMPVVAPKSDILLEKRPRFRRRYYSRSNYRRRPYAGSCYCVGSRRFESRRNSGYRNSKNIELRINELNDKISVFQKKRVNVFEISGRETNHPENNRRSIALLQKKNRDLQRDLASLRRDFLVIRNELQLMKRRNKLLRRSLLRIARILRTYREDLNKVKSYLDKVRTRINASR